MPEKSDPGCSKTKTWTKPAKLLRSNMLLCGKIIELKFVLDNIREESFDWHQLKCIRTTIGLVCLTINILGIQVVKSSRCRWISRCSDVVDLIGYMNIQIKFYFSVISYVCIEPMFNTSVYVGYVFMAHKIFDF